MSDCFEMNGYTYTLLLNDFEHVHRYHMVNNHKMQILICSQLNEKFKCDDEKCNISHRRSRQTKKLFRIDKQSLFAAKLDDIHSYFLQFGLCYSVQIFQLILG